jgi:hypothetical protein
MKFLVDTNVISELRNPARTHPNVRRWADSIQLADSAISSIVLMELELGALQVRRRNPRLHSDLKEWISKSVLLQYGGRILPVDDQVAVRCAQLLYPKTLPLNDAMIAATALVHGLTVVTRNIGDFSRMEVDVLDPWQA